MTQLPPVSSISRLAPARPHADAAAKAREDLTGGDKGRVYTETLPNGTRLIVAERPGAKGVKVQVGANAGSLEDPQGKLGLAHLLEHLAFEGSPTMSASKQEKLRTELGGQWNAYTDLDSTIYYGVVPNKDAARGAKLVTDMYANPKTTGPRVKQELAAVQNEMLYGDGSIRGELWHINERLVNGDGPLTNNVIGSRPSVQAISGKDMRDYHSRYYTGRNTVALVEGDPKHLPLDIVRKQLAKLAPGARVDHTGIQQPPRAGKAVQVVPDRETGKVGITLSLPVSAAALEGAKVPAELVTSAIGNEFFDRLRRNHGLTYGVGVSMYPSGAAGDQVLEFSTDVAPKNARAAVRDLVATLKDAQDGFGPKTFATHKKQMLSGMKMHEPTGAEKTVGDAAEEMFQQTIGAPGFAAPTEATPGVTVKEEATELATAEKALKRATYKAFQATAGQLVDLENMKLLAHGPLTGTADILGGIRDAKVATKGIAINPVDLKLYSDMGVRGPAAAPAKPKAKARSHAHAH